MQGWNRVLTIPGSSKWLPRGSVGMLLLRSKPHIYFDVIYAHIWFQQKGPEGLHAFRLYGAIARTVSGFSCSCLAAGHLDFHLLLEIIAGYSQGVWGREQPILHLVETLR